MQLKRNCLTFLIVSMLIVSFCYLHVKVAHGTVSSITLINPSDNVQTLDTTPTMTFKPVSDVSETINCTLFIDDVASGDEQVTNNTQASITCNHTLTASDIKKEWYINATDTDGTYKSSVRNIGIGPYFKVPVILVNPNSPSQWLYYFNASTTDYATTKPIEIKDNHITIDGQGLTLDGNDLVNYGIYLYRSSITNTGIIIYNITVRDFKQGNIYIYQARQNTIHNVTLLSGPDNGIIFYYSNNNVFENSTVANNKHGIDIIWTNSLTVSNVIIRDNAQRGIWMDYAKSNQIYGCTIENNGVAGLYLAGATNPPNSFYNNLFNNTVNVDRSGIYSNKWNTSKTQGFRAYSDGIFIGGNFWAKPDHSGYSETGTDADMDGFIDSPHSIGNGYDYLPYSSAYRFATSFEESDPFGDWTPCPVFGYGYEIQTDIVHSGNNACRSLLNDGSMHHELSQNRTTHNFLVYFYINGSVPDGYGGGLFIRIWDPEIAVYIETNASRGAGKSPYIRFYDQMNDDFNVLDTQGLALETWHSLQVYTEGDSASANHKCWVDGRLIADVSDDTSGYKVTGVTVNSFWWSGEWDGRVFVDDFYSDNSMIPIYYFYFNFYDLDSQDVELYVDWALWDSTQDLGYTEGDPSLDSGTYYLKTSKYEHLINTTTLDTATYGNSTIDIYPQMKRHQTCSNGFIALNNTVSTIIIHAETPQLLNFTITGSTPAQFGVGVPKNASYIQKDGSNITDWVYVQSPSHIQFNQSSFSTYTFHFPSTSDPVVGPHTPMNNRVKVTVRLNDEWLTGCNVTVEGGPDNRLEWALTDVFGSVKFNLKTGSYDIVASYEQYSKGKSVYVSTHMTIGIDLTEEDIISPDVLPDALEDFLTWVKLPEIDFTTETFLVFILPLIVLVAYAIKKATEGPKKKWKYSYLK